jgi:hypothetical protein
MFSTVRDSGNEGNSNLPPRCAETVERSKFLWKKKENRVRILGAGQNVVPVVLLTTDHQPLPTAVNYPR